VQTARIKKKKIRKKKERKKKITWGGIIAAPLRGSIDRLEKISRSTNL